MQIAQLSIHDALRFLCILDRLCLERLDRFQLPADIIRHRFETLEVVLNLIDDGLVLEDRAVGGEVDGLGLLGEDL